MKNYLDINAIDDLDKWLEEIQILKQNPYKYRLPKKPRTLGMLFFNPSLRTRMSTQKAAKMLGKKLKS